MEKTLALDLGSNSIGWTIRDSSFPKDQQFRRSGVVTFNQGVGVEKNVEYSFAAQRTTKRSIRRLYQSRKYKLWETLDMLRRAGYCPISEEELNQWRWYKRERGYVRKYPVDAVRFNQWIKLDFNGDGKPDYTSPYQLRSELAKEKLDFSSEENRYKLGRALYHIAQHRAFRSSKKVNLKEDKDAENIDIGAERTKHRELGKKLEGLGLSFDGTKTIGQLFAEAEGIYAERKEGRIRNNLHTYVIRKDLQSEVKTILDFQGLDFGKLFTNGNGEPLTISRSPIFWQRPLRSQKGTIGKCTLEPTKYRCPVSHPAFEEFRAWSFLNNIQYRSKVGTSKEWQQLDLTLREQLYRDKFIDRMKPNFDFSEIYKWLKDKNGNDNWELNYNPKTNVAACPVSARLRDVFGPEWNTIRIQHAPNVRRGGQKGKKDFYTIEDIWHVPFSCDDEEFVRSFAAEKLNLDEKKTESYIKLWESMPVDYAQLSLKAIQRINYFLRKGLIYTEAALLAKVPDILGERWKENENFLLKSIGQVISENRIIKKRKGIVNNLIAKFKARPFHEKSAESSLDYVLDNADLEQIRIECIDSFGPVTWEGMSADERDKVIAYVSSEYQCFFQDAERKFRKMPHLLDSMKSFLMDNFDLSLSEVKRLYHPSQIEIYAPSKRKYYESYRKEMLLLGSPKTGAFKNPMAMRALFEVRRLVNYLIATDQIDEHTRVVVELARELNDSNKRWAIEKYQQMRLEENKLFAEAIHELVKDHGVIADAKSSDDIDKFRLWYDMLQGESALVGYEKGKVFVENEVEAKSRNRRGKEEEYEVFSENAFEKVNKQLYFKLMSAGDDVVTKYRLWKEQKSLCIYTGRMISLTQLFQPGAIDFEHTLPRSKSFDNSLENLTVCFADYNRRVKKNRIPVDLPNYDEDTPEGTAIRPRLEVWEKKVSDIELHIEFWKSKSKRATTKEDKDKAIRQKHLWQFDLDYWRGKLQRFKMVEVKSGFKNSQLVDTQIISKYAYHYLRTVFSEVEVQKGANTAVFRKILGIQQLDDRKDRSKHSHHAKDAMVLSVIPVATLREQFLKVWYELDELKKLLPNAGEDGEEIRFNIRQLESRLDELRSQGNFPRINEAIEKLDREVLINSIGRDQTLTPVRKRVRSRGKVVGLKDAEGNDLYEVDSTGRPIQLVRHGKLVFKYDHNGELILDENGTPIPVYKVKAKWAQGDNIRGQLFLDTFYGKIRPAKWDEQGRPMKDESGRFIYEEKNEGFRFVLRKSVDKDLDVDKIVDPVLKRRIIDQLKGRTIEKTIGEEGGLWMTDKNGNRINRIRHIRCFADDVTNPLAIKRQTYVSSKEYKNDYWSKSGENYICALYQSEKRNKRGEPVVRDGKVLIHREFEIYSLAEIAKRRSGDLNSKTLGLYRRDKTSGLDLVGDDGLKEEPYAVLRKGTRVLFYKNGIEELTELLVNNREELNRRLYRVKKFADARITFDFHLEAREDIQLVKDFPEKGFFKLDDKGKEVTFGKRGKNGFTEDFFDSDKLNQGRPWHRLLYSKDYFDFAIEDKHFSISPDGEIVWLI